MFEQKSSGFWLAVEWCRVNHASCCTCEFCRALGRPCAVPETEVKP